MAFSDANPPCPLPEHNEITGYTAPPPSYHSPNVCTSSGLINQLRCSVCRTPIVAFVSEEPNGTKNLNLFDGEGNHLFSDCMVLYCGRAIMDDGLVNDLRPQPIRDHALAGGGATSHEAAVGDANTPSGYSPTILPTPPQSPHGQQILNPARRGGRSPPPRKGSSGRDKTKAQRRESRTKELRREPKKKLFFCGEPGCGQGFVRITDLRRHNKSASIHNPEKQLKCTACGTGFNRIDNLYQHGRNKCKRNKGQRGPEAKGARTSPPPPESYPKTLNTHIESRSMETGAFAPGWAMELDKRSTSFSPRSLYRI